MIESSKYYKVVKIIDDKQIVVNAGTNNSISINDKLEIFQQGLEITDPDTKESLGTLDYTKARLTVTTVLPKMCVCARMVIPERSLYVLAGLTAREIADYLDVDPADISGGYEDIDKKIKVGDLVRKLLN